MAKLIAFQGEPGAFSHAASHALFPRGEPVPCPTFEDTISAEDNVRIVDRAQSKAVLVYYDLGNSTIAGFDPVNWLCLACFLVVRRAPTAARS